ncbi:uncharacterized protein LOC104896335 isoform X2 [Beta vulgaris subsp. vulgaris]|uniref:uncharacterized protein LOC104896335 isoform X2 n=1 Tax=Beta vulgaris subsp. vulgaris TaxID=3555 RepID=UPI002548BDE3|nr:uncharacterized protein LOC104896335 isoform X2 [Beta vulgaris subsp. vulgaris]
MTATVIPAIFSLLSSSSYRPTTSTFHKYPLNFHPSLNFTPKLNPRLRISHTAKQYYWVPSCCGGNAGLNSDITNDSSKLVWSVSVRVGQHRLANIVARTGFRNQTLTHNFLGEACSYNLHAMLVVKEQKGL